MKLKVSVVILVSVFITVDCWGLGVESCEDISPNCHQNLDRCSWSSFVQHRCRKSCNMCDSQLSCDDVSHNCRRNLQSCISSTTVQFRCMKSCGLCGNMGQSCEDISPNCHANTHLCTDSTYVQFVCMKTCGLCVNHTPVQKACPGGVVIAGQCLVIYNEKVSWGEANSKCWHKYGMQYGSPGGLASLNDPKAFMDYAKVHHPGDILWLGGTDRRREGVWYWVNGKQFGNRFPWVSGEPNNHDGNQHCLSWGGVTDVNGYTNYDDRTCTEEHKYVCEHY